MDRKPVAVTLARTSTAATRARVYRAVAAATRRLQALQEEAATLQHQLERELMRTVGATGAPPCPDAELWQMRALIVEWQWLGTVTGAGLGNLYQTGRSAEFRANMTPRPWSRAPEEMVE
jgi:hypothetical protein